jgi:hypothetical protein
VEAQIVVMSSDSGNAFETRLTESTADSAYSMDHLPPGDYRIIAVSKASFSLNSLEGYDDQMDEFSIRNDEDFERAKAANA